MNKNMASQCAAKNCNSNENTTNKGEKLKFFQYPLDPKLKQQWEAVSKPFTEKEKHNSPRLMCELHFDKSCFDTKKQLNSNAIPSKINELKRSLEKVNIVECPSKKKATDASATQKLKENVNASKSHGNNNNSLKRSYRLTIQIHKIYEKPSLKSEKDSNDDNLESNLTNVSLDSNQHTCLVCKRVFTNVPEFYVHIKKHFTCDICKSEFTSKKFYQKHMRLHDNNSKEYPFKCHICKAIFDSKDSIRKHNHCNPGTQANEPELKVLTCKTCYLSFKNEANYKKHLTTHMEKLPTNTTEKATPSSSPATPKQVNFGCPECGKQFKTIAEIEKHSVIHFKQNMISTK